MNRKPIFDAVRKMLERGFTLAEIKALDRAITLAEGALPAGEALAPPEPLPMPLAPHVWALGDKGAKLIKKWEGCHKRRADGKYDAYPDPGSSNGKPWTIGWGSTGTDIKKGTVWTRAECNARFDVDIQRYVDEVAQFIGATPTTPNQFDALVSFHYNTGAIARSTLGKRHKAGRYDDAKAEFGKWIYNDGRAMQGLKNRRADEAKLYATA